ncbi:MAG: 3-hydroxybutyryl-CoA dehydrogenase [Flavobacteriales bacterium]|nr:3-hydroxybutyryl-CoA dehydrogenase [Flavobacteriales bacterium]
MKNISVIGAGTMGNGIAHVFAQNGYQVNLIDVSQEALEKAVKTISRNLDRMVAKEKITELQKKNTLNNLTTISEIKSGVENAELVIEAATENLDIKLSIFKEIDLNSPKECILSTNTSSISITKIAANTSRADKVIGMHFMNPVPIMKLIEVIKGYSTSAQTLETIMKLSKKIGKSPVEVNDFPGFVANKILIPMINEAIITLHEGVAGVEEIDTVMKLGMAHPMGPLQLADFIGLDVCLAILKVLQQGFGTDKYAPCPLLVNMVTAGKLGVKSGEGFYSWKHKTKELFVSEYFK